MKKSVPGPNPWRWIAAVLLSGSLTTAWPHDLGGEWWLKIENLDHQLITSTTLHFTQEAARSCLGGSWQRVIATSPATTDPRFFPVTEPLSYRVEGSTLTIGRNEVCDGYRHLSGSLGDSPIQGEYIGFGITGGSRLGYFSLTRKPPAKAP